MPIEEVRERIDGRDPAVAAVILVVQRDEAPVGAAASAAGAAGAPEKSTVVPRGMTSTG